MYKPLLMAAWLLLMQSGISAMAQQLYTPEYFLAQARLHSPLINRSTNDMQLTDLSLKQNLRSATGISVSLDGQVLLAPIVSNDNAQSRFEVTSEGATSYTGYDLGITNGGQFAAQISIQQPLLSRAAVNVFSEKAQIQHEQSLNAIDLTTHALEQAVFDQYLQCYSAKIAAESSDELFKMIQQQVVIMQKLTESAIYRQTDLQLLKIAATNQEADCKASRAAYCDNLYALFALCGIADTVSSDIHATDFTLRANPVTESAFAAAYRLDSLSVASGLNESNLKYKPQLSWYAYAGQNAVYLPSVNRFGFSAGLSFTWLLFDGHQKQTEQQKAGISQQSLKFEKQMMLQQNTFEKKRLLEQIKASDEQMAIGAELLNQYKTLLNSYNTELSQGQISVMDYRNLLRDVAAQQQKNLRFTIQKQQLINNYNYYNY